MILLLKKFDWIEMRLAEAGQMGFVEISRAVQGKSII
jgi:hypothetical protein